MCEGGRERERGRERARERQRERERERVEKLENMLKRSVVDGSLG